MYTTAQPTPFPATSSVATHMCIVWSAVLAVLSYAVLFSFSKTILVLINYRVVIYSLKTIVFRALQLVRRAFEGGSRVIPRKAWLQAGLEHSGWFLLVEWLLRDSKSLVPSAGTSGYWRCPHMLRALGIWTGSCFLDSVTRNWMIGDAPVQGGNDPKEGACYSPCW